MAAAAVRALGTALPDVLPAVCACVCVCTRTYLTPHAWLCCCCCLQDYYPESLGQVGMGSHAGGRTSICVLQGVFCR